LPFQGQPQAGVAERALTIAITGPAPSRRPVKIAISGTAPTGLGSEKVINLSGREDMKWIFCSSWIVFAFASIFRYRWCYSSFSSQFVLRTSALGRST